MYRTINLIQGSPEWLAARFEHVTASNVGALYNVDPYKTALQYATELLTKAAPKHDESKQALFAKGHAVEAAAREWVKSNLNIDMTPAVVVSERLPCLMASLDGMDAERRVIFEAKYIGKDALEDVKRGIIKPHHIYQVQAQLLATGFDKCVYFAMDPDGNAAVMDITPDAEFQARIMSGIAAFWYGLSIGRLPETCARDIHMVDDPQLSMLAEMDAKMSALKKEYDSLEEIVLAKYADKSRVQGGGVSITRNWRSGSMDWAALAKTKEISKEEQEKFRKGGSLITQVRFSKKGN